MRNWILITLLSGGVAAQASELRLLPRQVDLVGPEAQHRLLATRFEGARYASSSSAEERVVAGADCRNR